MALKDWAGLAGQAANAWQLRENYEDAQTAIDKGFEQARTDVQQYQVPYTNFGLEHMQGYNDMGEFSFSNEDFYRDPSYQWRMDQGMENTLRQQAAAKQVGSGNTLARLTELGQNMASQEYQAAFDRAQGTYDTNRAYHQFGVETGSGMAKELGTNLAELGIGKAGATASLHASLAEGQSRIISSTLANMGGGDPGSISGIIGDAIDTFGGLTSGAVDMISKATGISPTGIMGAIKGAGASVLNETAGAAWGLFGAGPQTLSGGGAAASGGSAGAASGAGGVGLGATLAAASPLLAFGGIIALDQLLSSEPKVGKSIEKIKNSSDPLATIGTMSGSDLDALFARDEAKTAVSYGTSGEQKRGTMYSMILNTLPPEQIKQIQKRPDIQTITNDLFQATLSGRELHAKLGDIGNTSSAEALGKLYPDLAGQFKQLEQLALTVRRHTAYNEDFGGDFNGVTRSARPVPTDELNALRASISAQMASYQGQWERRSNIEKEVGDL